MKAIQIEEFGGPEVMNLVELPDPLKAFNSYPRADVAAGTYVLAQAFTGDARGALIDGPKTLRFALGAPKTDIYVDHWTLPKGSATTSAPPLRVRSGWAIQSWMPSRVPR